ncbi:hypothetical protein MASR2M79_07760 [Aminivibrio sp.]
MLRMVQSLFFSKFRSETFYGFYPEKWVRPFQGKKNCFLGFDINKEVNFKEETNEKSG